MVSKKHIVPVADKAAKIEKKVTKLMPNRMVTAEQKTESKAKAAKPTLNPPVKKPTKAESTKAKKQVSARELMTQMQRKVSDSLK